MQGKAKQSSFLIADIICFYLALFVSLLIRLRANFEFNKFLDHIGPFTITLFFWLLIFYIAGLYDLKNFSKKFLHFKLFIGAILTAIIFSIVYFYLARIPDITPKTILIIFAIVFAIMDYFMRKYLFKYFAGAQPLLNIFILGKGKDVKELVDFIKENPQLGYKVELWMDSVKENELGSLIKNNNINTVLVVSELRKNQSLSAQIYQQMLNGIDILDFCEFYENIFGKISLDELEESWFLGKIIPRNGFYLFLKRSSDIIFAIVLSLVGIALFPIIALLAIISSPGNVFFKQKRVGLQEKIITVYKFRTMHKLKNVDVQDVLFKKGDLNLEAKENLSRIFWFGKILRKIRLDELPQVINVLKGELSFIGPRVEFIDLHNHLKEKIPYYQIGTIIKPGLTGWAQIHGKNSNTVDDAKERLAYDIYYIKNRSLALDLIITLKTLKTIFSLSGV